MGVVLGGSGQGIQGGRQKEAKLPDFQLHANSSLLPSLPPPTIPVLPLHGGAHVRRIVTEDLHNSACAHVQAGWRWPYVDVWLYHAPVQVRSGRNAGRCRVATVCSPAIAVCTACSFSASECNQQHQQALCTSTGFVCSSTTELELLSFPASVPWRDGRQRAARLGEPPLQPIA